MIKTVKIGNKEVTLDNNIGWTLIYRDQFGQDILPVVMPVLASAIDVISGVIQEMDGKKEITVQDLAKVVNGETFMNAMIHGSAFEFADFVNIIWAMAKNADEDIPDPRVWIKQFDEFPLDIVGVEAVKLIFKGLVSSKNLMRVNDLIKSVHPKQTSPSISTPSSSQD